MNEFILSQTFKNIRFYCGVVGILALMLADWFTGISTAIILIGYALIGVYGVSSSVYTLSLLKVAQLISPDDLEAVFGKSLQLHKASLLLVSIGITLVTSLASTSLIFTLHSPWLFVSILFGLLICFPGLYSESLLVKAVNRHPLRLDSHLSQ